MQSGCVCSPEKPSQGRWQDIALGITITASLQPRVLDKRPAARNVVFPGP